MYEIRKNTETVSVRNLPETEFRKDTKIRKEDLWNI